MNEIKEELNKILTKKAITRLQFIIFLIGIGFFVFTDTQLFRELNDAIKVVCYIALYGMAVIFGVELFQAKQLAINIRDILNDNKLDLGSKIMAITGIVADALVKLGEAWEIFDREQFSTLPEEPISQIDPKTQELVKKIEEKLEKL